MIYFDFEYRNAEVVSELVLVALKNSKDTKDSYLFDLRTTEDREIFKKYYKDHEGEVWCCFNGLADLTCLLALGLDIRELKFIDAMTESRMISLTHPDYLLFEQNLLTTLKGFGIINPCQYDLAKDLKESSRDLILLNKVYEEEQWTQICAYALEDVIHLPKLMNKIATVHNDIEDGTVINHMLHRGEFSKATTVLNFKAKGYPINVERLSSIYGNADRIRLRMITEINTQYGDKEHPIYRFVPDNSKSTQGRWAFNNTEFSWLITEKLKILDWGRTPSGMLNLQKDYLDEKCGSIPLLLNLNLTRKTLTALSKDNITGRLKGKHIRAEPFIFAQKTGRCSPKPTKGFILNMTPWLRSALIHPSAGEAFIGIDWSQQEIGIAAVLSGDENLLEVYNSSDAYITLAIMAGAVPPEATKKSHPVIRQNFKAVQLGIGYGKGIKSLAVDIWENNRDAVSGEEGISREEALTKSKEIYDWHKRQFSVYWDWIKQNALEAKLNGYIASEDKWIMYCDRTARTTQIQNFPMQANGAAMLRRAVYHVWQTGVLELVCPLHDALYIRCQESEAEHHAALLGDCMDKACKDILGNTLTLKRDPADIYTHEKPYYDERGWSLYETIYKELGEVMLHSGHEKLREQKERPKGSVSLYSH